MGINPAELPSVVALCLGFLPALAVKPQELGTAALVVDPWASKSLPKLALRRDLFPSGKHCGRFRKCFLTSRSLDRHEPHAGQRPTRRQR